jgi:hypothetical protein
MSFRQKHNHVIQSVYAGKKEKLCTNSHTPSLSQKPGLCADEKQTPTEPKYFTYLMFAFPPKNN